MFVSEVGTGVGYFDCCGPDSSSYLRFLEGAAIGDEDSGSKAGNSVGRVPFDCEEAGDIMPFSTRCVGFDAFPKSVIVGLGMVSTD